MTSDISTSELPPSVFSSSKFPSTASCSHCSNPPPFFSVRTSSKSFLIDRKQVQASVSASDDSSSDFSPSELLTAESSSSEFPSTASWSNCSNHPLLLSERTSSKSFLECHFLWCYFLVSTFFIFFLLVALIFF